MPPASELMARLLAFVLETTGALFLMCAINCLRDTKIAVQSGGVLRETRYFASSKIHAYCHIARVCVEGRPLQ